MDHPPERRTTFWNGGLLDCIKCNGVRPQATIFVLEKITPKELKHFDFAREAQS